MPIQVPTQAVSVQDAVETYLFNSQLLSRDDGSMMLVLPQESRNHQGRLALSQRTGAGG